MPLACRTLTNSYFCADEDFCDSANTLLAFKLRDAKKNDFEEKPGQIYFWFCVANQC